MRSTRLFFVAQKNYYFLDKNVIVNYMKKNPRIVEFLDNTNNEFVYTETVLLELRIHRTEINPRFRFTDSELSTERKMNAIDRLDKLWHKEFDDAEKRGFGLSQKQLLKFRKNLFVVFEASYCRYNRSVLDDNDPRAPILLTNNMLFYNKFLFRSRTQDILDEVIGLSCFERLIPVKTIL